MFNKSNCFCSPEGNTSHEKQFGLLKMIRVLCLVSAMNAGGAETFLMKLYRCIDRSKYQMDFCVNVQEDCLYDSEILSMGGRIYRIPSKSENIKSFSKQLFHIVRDNGYKNVLRITSNDMGFYDLHIAKRAGAANCIARSSNSSDGGGLKPWVAHRIGRLLFKHDVDVEIAPSDLAALYTFGRKDFRTGKITILHNGIDFDQFVFSQEDRNRIRQELEISDDCYVIGHIGRFVEQKNHSFLLDVFDEVRKDYPNIKLLLVGEGELEKTIECECKRKDIRDLVIISKVRTDIPAILSSMDLLAFPSYYEGMPNVLIEAQASGLPCFISDRITKDVILTDTIKQLSIDSTSYWVKGIEDAIEERMRTQNEIIERREVQQLPDEYNIHNVCDVFTSFLT